MTDQDIQNVYRSNLGTSESAALRAVFDAGWYEALGNFNPVNAPDPSLTAVIPISEVIVTTL